jgi:hypothetical protein
VSDSPTPRARTGELTDVTDRDPTEDVLAPRTRVLQAFRDRFGEPATWLVRAPGRVNLIGEHTDYNDGFVLPMAIDRAVWIAARPRTDRTVALHSLDFGDAATIDLDAEPEHRRGSWAEYVIGMRWALARAGVVLTGGWEGTMAGNVPVGAGLSSSAALELAVARTLAAASDVAWDPPRMAVAAQAAENGWVGVNSGIMDQMISAAAREGHALLLDCRSLDGRHVPMPPTWWPWCSTRRRDAVWWRAPTTSGAPSARRRRAPSGCRRFATWTRRRSPRAPTRSTRRRGAAPGTSSPRTPARCRRPTRWRAATRPRWGGSWTPATPRCATTSRSRARSSTRSSRSRAPSRGATARG